MQDRPLAPFLVLYTHLVVTVDAPGRSSHSSHVWFLMIESCSCIIAARHSELELAFVKVIRLVGSFAMPKKQSTFIGWRGLTVSTEYVTLFLSREEGFLGQAGGWCRVCCCVGAGLEDSDVEFCKVLVAIDIRLRNFGFACSINSSPRQLTGLCRSEDGMFWVSSMSVVSWGVTVLPKWLSKRVFSGECRADWSSSEVTIAGLVLFLSQSANECNYEVSLDRMEPLLNRTVWVMMSLWSAGIHTR